MQFVKRTLMVLFLVGLGEPADAVELRSIEVRTGTDGLVAVPLSVTNASGAPVVCVGQLAHWYSQELARAGTGATALIPLWFDPATGTFTVLNDKAENMPVESLWCGLEGRAYESRAAITLDRQADATPSPMALTCTLDGSRLTCG
ncbi:MAG: hypothetical protein ABJF67_00575 [Aurantimonas coralicida]|uniref:hypothetical protein n=1 Tax=Bauldia litoralis TaxID=665467 RepID=UPI00326417D5